MRIIQLSQEKLVEILSKKELQRYEFLEGNHPAYAALVELCNLLYPDLHGEILSILDEEEIFCEDRTEFNQKYIQKFLSLIKSK